MQPDWRQKDKRLWPPSRALPPLGVDWGRLSRVGPNGFFLVMVTLAWWAETVGKSMTPQYTEFEVAIKDVHWVLSEMIQQLPAVQLSAKRPSPDFENDGETTEKPRPKRCVLTHTV